MNVFSQWKIVVTVIAVMCAAVGAATYLCVPSMKKG
jgi:hypothetical protein